MMTPEELRFYQAGFKVAVNFLYHHQASEAERSAFGQYLNEHMDHEVVQEAISMINPDKAETTGVSCPPGECPIPGNGCRLCDFPFAYDGTYYTGRE